MTLLRRSRKGPLTGINSRFNTTTRITDSVALYLPPGISNNLSAVYGDSATGMAGYLALSGIDLVQQIKDHDFAGAASTLFDAGGMIATEAFKKFAVGVIEGFTGSEGVQQTFDKAFGQTLNPYMEVAYDSMGMRSFDYTFKFAPKSEKETGVLEDNKVKYKEWMLLYFIVMMFLYCIVSYINLPRNILHFYEVSIRRQILTVC